MARGAPRYIYYYTLVYYIFFTMFGMIQNIGKNFYSNHALFTMLPQRLRHLVAWLFTFTVVAYFGYSFNLLTVQKSLLFFSNFGYWPIYMLISVFVIGQSLSAVNPAKRKKKEL